MIENLHRHSRKSVFTGKTEIHVGEGKELLNKDSMLKASPYTGEDPKAFYEVSLDGMECYNSAGELNGPMWI